MPGIHHNYQTWKETGSARKGLAASLSKTKLKDLGNHRILQNRVLEGRKMHRTLGDLQRFQGVLMSVYL